MESKPCTPSVVARLMGIDNSLPTRPVDKPHQVLSENYLWKSASIGLLDRRPYYECHSFKGNYERGKVFTVFKEPQKQTVDGQRNQSIQCGNANPNITEVNNFFVRKNSTDAEHLSMDEKLWYSAVSSHSLEELDSDGNLLLKNHEKPHSLFANHLHGLVELQSDHVTVSKSLNDSYSRKSVISRKSLSATSLFNVLGSPQKFENDSYSDTCRDLTIDYTHPLLKSRLELKGKPGLSPSEIAVLKRNPGKTQIAEMCSVLSIYGEGCLPPDRIHVGFSKSRHVDLNSQVGKGRNLAGDTVLPRRKTHSDLLTDLTRTTEGNETYKNESEVAMPSCQSLFDWKYRGQAKYPPLSKSFFPKQAKKQILVRWKTSKSHQEDGEAVKGTTSGQMLATPFKKTRPENLNKIDVSAMNNQLSRNDAGGDFVSLLGISSGDGQKECAKCFTISESLPAASSTVVSSITRTRSPDEQKNSSGENDLFENSFEKLTLPNSPVSSVASMSLDSQMMAFSDTKNVEPPSGTLEKVQLEQGACILCFEEENSSHVLDDFVGQEMSIKSHGEPLISSSCPALGEEFPMSLGEGYSSSPNSVPEPLFTEEISLDSDTFQVAGANLQGSQVQLQLMKSESEEMNPEGHEIAVSSDEESGDGFGDFSKETRKLIGLFTTEESRDFSYVVDLLDESGFHGGDIGN